MTVVSNAKQAAALNHGDTFVLEPAGFGGTDHDPEAFAEAHRKLRDEVQAVLDNIAPPDRASDTIEVTFNETHVFMASIVDQSVEVAGDVRDGTVKLQAGKVSQRMITGEGFGFVSINGQRFELMTN